jgi:hypothetical protein
VAANSTRSRLQSTRRAEERSDVPIEVLLNRFELMAGLAT